jgi:Na+/proline symporter
LKFKFWIAAFVAVLFFNPSTITRFWAYDSVIIEDLIDATKLMYFSSLLLIIFSLLTLAMVVEIYKLQEIKKIKNGSITVDPLQ